LTVPTCAQDSRSHPRLSRKRHSGQIDSAKAAFDKNELPTLESGAMFLIPVGKWVGRYGCTADEGFTRLRVEGRRPSHNSAILPRPARPSWDCCLGSTRPGTCRRVESYLAHQVQGCFDALINLP
jgi:hypothetical protein